MALGILAEVDWGDLAQGLAAALYILSALGQGLVRLGKRVPKERRWPALRISIIVVGAMIAIVPLFLTLSFRVKLGLTVLVALAAIAGVIDVVRGRRESTPIPPTPAPVPRQQPRPIAPEEPSRRENVEPFASHYLDGEGVMLTLEHAETFSERVFCIVRVGEDRKQAEPTWVRSRLEVRYPDGFPNATLEDGHYRVEWVAQPRMFEFMGSRRLTKDEFDWPLAVSAPPSRTSAAAMAGRLAQELHSELVQPHATNVGGTAFHLKVSADYEGRFLARVLALASRLEATDVPDELLSILRRPVGTFAQIREVTVTLGVIAEMLRPGGE